MNWIRYEFFKIIIREVFGFIFLFIFLVMKVVVFGLDRIFEGDWIWVIVNVMICYKCLLVCLRLGNEFLWILWWDYKCKCLRLWFGWDYLIVGLIRFISRKKLIVVDYWSMVVLWNKNMDRKVEMIKKKC